jgi:hypothetical protein
MEALRSSEKSVLTRATRRNIPDDGILHNEVVHMYKQAIIYVQQHSFKPSVISSTAFNGLVQLILVFITLTAFPKIPYTH